MNQQINRQQLQQAQLQVNQINTSLTQVQQQVLQNIQKTAECEEKKNELEPSLKKAQTRLNRMKKFQKN